MLLHLIECYQREKNGIDNKVGNITSVKDKASSGVLSDDKVPQSQAPLISFYFTHRPAGGGFSQYKGGRGARRKFS